MNKKLTKTIILIVFVVFLGTYNVKATFYKKCYYNGDGQSMTIEINDTRSGAKRVDGFKATIMNWASKPEPTKNGTTVNYMGQDECRTVSDGTTSCSCPPRLYIAKWAVSRNSEAWFCNDTSSFNEVKSYTAERAKIDIGFLHPTYYSLSLTKEEEGKEEEKEPEEPEEEHDPKLCTGEDSEPSWCKDPEINVNVGDMKEDLTTYSCGNGFVTGIPNRIPRFTSILYNIIQILVPVVLVILGTLDLVKSLIGQKEDEIKKGQQVFIKRLISAIIVFFVFAIIKIVLSIVSNNSENIVNCLDCFIKNNESCVEES